MGWLVADDSATGHPRSAIPHPGGDLYRPPVPAGSEENRRDLRAYRPGPGLRIHWQDGPWFFVPRSKFSRSVFHHSKTGAFEDSVQKRTLA
jgi:hypothetical protein